MSNVTELDGAMEKLAEYESTGLTPEEIKDGQMLTGWGASGGKNAKGARRSVSYLRGRRNAGRLYPKLRRLVLGKSRRRNRGYRLDGTARTIQDKGE